MAVNSRLKATKIIGQRKAIYRQRIPESGCVTKETLCIDILATWRQKSHAIYQNNEKTSPENKELEPAEPVQISIYPSNTYRKDLSWLQFDNEQRVQEKQQVKD